MVELANWLGEQGVEHVHDPNLGGTVDFDWGSIKLVPAWHTNTTPGSEGAPGGTAIGTPAGLVIRIGGLTIYDAGDTCLFSDMELIGERHEVDLALLPIGGHYTMDRHDAAYAAAIIGADTRDPDPLRHLPADRDRRRGLSIRPDREGSRGAGPGAGRDARRCQPPVLCRSRAAGPTERGVRRA